jgi:diguanylate cyclase (GGDEF)-like protein
MSIFSKKYLLLAWISLVLVAGFLTTSVTGYIVSRDAIRQAIAEQALPITGDNIYSEIQKDVLRPQFISSLMANDTFVRDWILNGEQGQEQITRYLNEVKKKYGTVSSFLISERSHQYYFPGGTLKQVKENEPRDAWFFRVRAMKAPFETNVDFDMANRDTMTIFINYRVLDYAGNFIGATGVGLTFDAMTGLIDCYQKRFHRNIFFVDGAGHVVLAGKSMQGVQDSIRTMPGIRTVADAILKPSTVPTALEYALDKSTVLVNSRYIPELGWYLVVEQNLREDVISVQHVFFLNLAISCLVTVLVLVLALLAVNRHQRRIEYVASIDGLTGLFNRQTFDFLFGLAVRETERSGQPLSVILFDLDNFKLVNDRYGHLAGDKVLSEVAALARASLRGSDVIARWGGEEFLMLLKNCALGDATEIAEKLRQLVDSHDFSSAAAGLKITISLGVAEHLALESEEAFFARADAALYRAKDAGRNKTHAAVQPADAVA